MNPDELIFSVRVTARELEDHPNSTEYLNLFREISKAAYELKAFPALYGLESTWKIIEGEFELLKLHREMDGVGTPVSYFTDMVDLGFYPPPEVMLALTQCFKNYFDAGGKKSLDECFFGQAHKKKSSPAFNESLDLKYWAFHNFYGHPQARKKSGLSLIATAEKFLSAAFKSSSSEIDPESFIKGYRRWLRSKTKKKDKN